jgi:hypothetical protein
MEVLSLHSFVQHPSELRCCHQEEVQLLQPHHLWNALEAYVTGCVKLGLTLQTSFHQDRLHCRCHMAVTCRVNLMLMRVVGASFQKLYHISISYMSLYLSYRNIFLLFIDIFAIVFIFTYDAHKIVKQAICFTN